VQVSWLQHRRLVSKIYAITSLDRPLRSRTLRLPEFLDIWHTKVVGLSAHRTGHLYPKEMSLVLISVRSWVEPRALVMEGLSQQKIPFAPLGIETMSFRPVAQTLNQVFQHIHTHTLARARSRTRAATWNL